MEHQDKSREGLTIQKIIQPFLLCLPRNNHAIAKLELFSSLDVQALSDMFHKNIQGIILDIDECIAPHHGEILPENIAKILEIIARDIKIVVYSNMKKSDRYQALEMAGVPVYTGHAKPDPRGFQECCEMMSLSATQVLMVGDNFVTDGGAIRAGIDFVKIQPVHTVGESFVKQIKRLPQRFFRWIFSQVSDGYDVVLDRKVYQA